MVAAMRQAGSWRRGCMLWDHRAQRLADDHANAQWLGDELRKAGYSVEPVQTNMVYVQQVIRRR